MFNLLVVDDHPYQVDNIVYTIEQSGLTFDTIHKAYSGAEALDCIGRASIDVVITDIRMPEISGIDLIERIRRKSKRVKCILLSGYADFEYAQQALALQTSKYLMKPVESGELLATLRDVVGELRAEREAEHSYRQTLYTLRENLPILRGQLLQELLQGKRPPRSELAHKLAAYALPFAEGDAATLAAFQLEDDLTGYNEYDISLILYGISNMAEEIFRDGFHVWHARATSKRLVVLVRAAEGDDAAQQERLERKAKELQRLVYRYLKHMVSVAVVRSGIAFPDGLPAAYEKAKQAFRSPEGKAAGFFAGMSELPEPVLRGTIESLYRQPSLMTLLETGRWADARARLADICNELERKGAVSGEYLSEAFFVIAGTFQFAAHRSGKRLIDAIGASDHQLLQEYADWDLSQLRSWALRSLGRMETESREAPGEANLSLVRRIHQFIEANLSRDLSLQSISDAVGLHPAYLSKVYKEETGATLSDYLLQYRMAYSADLLQNTDCKIYEVSSKVGYQTPHYFIKLFKKAYGMTPQQYRNTMKKGANGRF